MHASRKIKLKLELKIYIVLGSVTISILVYIWYKDNKLAIGYFFDQFQHWHLAKQNPFWLANFIVHFQWDSNQ